MDLAYNHQEVEKKWQKKWEESHVFKADNKSQKEKKYVLDMFPYPSGAGLHVGHPEGYTATDIYSRYLRMKGYEVIHPLGWDAFGLPAENYAIKIGVHPQKSTRENIVNFTKQIKSFGFSYDWDREINTSDPSYYKWSQWFFLLLYKNGLAYKKKAPVNWCESCKTVLANEQVVDGHCERCKNEVIKKDLEQWFFKVTEYAEELLDGLDNLEWSHALKTMQRNWIGKSEGAEIEFRIKNNELRITDTKEIFLASNNKSKKERIEKIFKHLNIDIKVLAPKDLKIETPEIKEEGNLLENAEEKAKAYQEKVKMPILAMDTGFFIDDQSFDPVKVKRNALVGCKEEDLSQEEIYRKMVDYYKEIANQHGGQVDAHFIDAITLIDSEGKLSNFEIKREVILTNEEHETGDIYFPINTLYKLKNCGKYSADKTDQEEIEWLEDLVNTLKNIFDPNIKVFTTRPDTLYGATYMVLAPEHKLVQDLKDSIENFSEVENYIETTKKKSDLERTDLNKNKTGVELKGIKAINPVNKQELPVYISDYVLATYGTGAIMCVPAHDQRDFEFAQKFKLPIIDVVKSERKTKVLIIHGFMATSQSDWFQWLKKELEELNYEVLIPDMPNTDHPILKDWSKSLEALVTDFTEDDIVIGHSMGAFAAQYLAQKTKINKLFLVAPVSEFMVNDETKTESIKKTFTAEQIEILREFTDYKLNYQSINANVEKIYAYFSDDDPYTSPKQQEQLVEKLPGKYQVLNNKGHINVSDSRASVSELPEIISDIVEKIRATEANGLMANSEEFSGMDSKKAKKKITKKAEGKSTTQYKIRDWLVSRQRYWGAPIPIVYCPNCGTVPVPEENLPVLLPDDVQDFRPTGQPPLASSKEFNSNVKCPKCGADATREHDTMDGFVDNSWYYYRYLDPRNKKEFCAKDLIKEWMPVDTYVGGAEHAVGHLIYSRFFTKVLRDNGYLPVDRSLGEGGKFDEPFLKLINQGLILGIDGQKMSKSLGNVINPDEIIQEYGADSFRMYEMFMGPLEDSKPWNIDGIKGLRRFLDKNWKYFLNISYGEDSNDSVESALHKTIKKVSEDIQGFRFNTAISSLMVCFKEFNALSKPSRELVNPYLIMLSTLAPHIGEEIWNKLGNEGFICQQEWPKYDEKLIGEEKINLPIQINGKLRATLEIEVDTSEDSLKKQILGLENVQKFIDGKEIIKFIYIKNKIVNIVL
jgi:leucyl-tRNA synthetase